MRLHSRKTSGRKGEGVEGQPPAMGGQMASTSPSTKVVVQRFSGSM
jgi:hypothetical protein